MWKYLGVVVVALLFGMVSPFLVAADNGPIMQTWFLWLPIELDLLLMPNTEMMMLVLAVVALTAQYLVILLLVIPLQPLVRKAVKAIFRTLRIGMFPH